MLQVIQWRQQLPQLAGISQEVSAVFDDNARPVGFDAGERLFPQERPAHELVLPVSGKIRVERPSTFGSGRVLYCVVAGEDCPLSQGCHLSFEARMSEVIADSDVEAVLLPRAAFDGLMQRSKDFRAFVFAAFAKRITDNHVIVEETATTGMDARLAARLLELCGASLCGLVRQRLSIDLGAPPLVISRHLAEFERRGWISERQGWITIRDPAAIRGLANHSQYYLGPGSMSGHFHRRETHDERKCRND